MLYYYYTICYKCILSCFLKLLSLSLSVSIYLLIAYPKLKSYLVKFKIIIKIDKNVKKYVHLLMLRLLFLNVIFLENIILRYYKVRYFLQIKIRLKLEDSSDN